MRSETFADILHCFVSGMRPADEAPRHGKLAGVRFGVKDLIDVAGEPTGGGCATPRIPTASRSAEVVERLLAAGAIYAGKTHTVQLAFGGWGTNTCTGAPRNPWDAEAFRIAGGSSSGSAVAVAAGLVDFALGTDTGGSVRIPASLCGVVGLKPAWGTVSSHGVLPLAPSLDSVGVLAGEVALAARAFAVMTDREAVTCPAGLGSLRFRFLDGADLTGEEDVLAAYRTSLAKIKAAAGEAVCLPLPVSPGDYVQPTGHILGHEAWALYRDFVQAGPALDAGVRARFTDAALIKEGDYRAALAKRADDQSIFLRWFEGADILVTPTTPRTAERLEAVNEKDFTPSRYTRIANYLNLCGLSLPCGLDRSGLPIGFQLLARACDEDLLIAAGLALGPLLMDRSILPPFHVRSHLSGPWDCR